MGRIHAFLHRDADEFFEQLANAELRFFKRHPWRAHGLGLLCAGASFGTVWLMGGLRTAVILFGACFVVFFVLTMIASVRIRRRR
jgi:hypothetical protein